MVDLAPHCCPPTELDEIKKEQKEALELEATGKAEEAAAVIEAAVESVDETSSVV